MSQSIPEQLDQADKLFGVINTRSGLKERLANIGYMDDRIAEGLAYHQSAKEYFANKHDTTVQKHSLSAQALQLTKEIKEKAGDVAQLARKLFAKNSTALEQLGLLRGTASNPRGPRDRSSVAEIARIRMLYDGILENPAILAAFTPFGYTFEILEAERTKIEDLNKIDCQHINARASRKASVRQQHMSLEAYREWFDLFCTVVRIRLKDYPEDLDALGIKR